MYVYTLSDDDDDRHHHFDYYYYQRISSPIWFDELIAHVFTSAQARIPPAHISRLKNVYSDNG